MFRSFFQKILSCECNDSPHCPQFIRESVLEVLGNSIRDAKVYENLAPRFIDFCTEHHIENILEIGAGSGESTAVFVDAVIRHQQTPPHIYISDLLPMREVMRATAARYPDVLTPLEDSLDIRNPAAAPAHDMRMVLSAFHHFDPEVVRTFFKAAQEQHIAVFIAEPFTNSLRAFFPMFLHGFISLARNGVQSSRMRLVKFFFTFLLPLIPMCLLWDGLISMIRMYDEQGFMEIVKTLPESGGAYQWHYEEVTVPLGGTASLFTGYPVAGTPAGHSKE
jgi:hypothetical protein